MHIPKVHTDLWQKIAHFNLNDPNASFSFTDRLARENGWPADFAWRVVQEYKRFIFLICIHPTPLTPSDQVDQAWHLHLIYTQSYWIDWCKRTLGQDIHHGPTKGGSQEKQKYHNLYQNTLDLYTSIFGHQPPLDIWPAPEIRFKEIVFQRVNKHRYWIIPKSPFKR